MSVEPLVQCGRVSRTLLCTGREGIGALGALRADLYSGVVLLWCCAPASVEIAVGHPVGAPSDSHRACLFLVCVRASALRTCGAHVASVEK